MANPGANRDANAIAKPIAAADYFALAAFLQKREQIQRGHKRDPHSEAVRSAGELYQSKDYVRAYETFKPVYDRVATDMQRVLARNVELEAKKMAAQQGKSLAVAKENVVQMRAHAQQLADQFEKLRQDLESKPLVRLHIKRGRVVATETPKPEEPSPTTFTSAEETRVEVKPSEPVEVTLGPDRYRKAPYEPPKIGSIYAVRDKAQADRVIRVIATSDDGAQIQVEILEEGSSTKAIALTTDSLARQAAKGWCQLLVPVIKQSQAPTKPRHPAARATGDGKTMRIDIQNFGRLCGTVAIANLKFNTQVIKDVADGSFRAGEYEKAFLTFEQLVTGFSSAINMGRQEISDGRRQLIADKGRLSGKEVQERTALLVRREQRIFAAEREFSAILEGLRMFVMT
jgi:hypothetical protein